MTLFNKIFGQSGGGVQGLLSNPAFMVGAGLLSSNGQMSGALQGLAAAQGYKLSEAKTKLIEEQEKRRAELEAMQMQALKAAQDREAYTRAIMQGVTSGGMSEAPEALRARLAMYGDLKMAELGGLIPPLSTSTELPADARLYEWAKQSPERMEFLNRNNSTQSPAVLQEWQAFSGMSPEQQQAFLAMKRASQTYDVGGVPHVLTPGGTQRSLATPDEVAANEALAAHDAAVARVTGEASGVRAKNAPENNMTLRELDAISADGGLLDQSTGSTFGALRDRAAAGFGVSTEGAEAIARLKPIADRVLKLVPRFEGPQSDKDTISYREAAGQLADPTIPAATRKAAAKEIARLMRERAGQFQEVGGPLMQVVPGSSPAQGGGAVPGTKEAEAAALRAKYGL